MAQPYVGEIRMFGGNFPPAGWMFCSGQLISIAQNETLFQLIGTTYGGDGQSTFALPDLRGRIPIHQGNNYVLAESGGVEQVTLAGSQIPQHTHSWRASSVASTGLNNPQGAVLARASGADVYTTDLVPVPLAPQMVSATGGNQPHNNIQPYLCVNFIISLFGIFPSPN
jgi:microcystin-dependent protein